MELALGILGAFGGVCTILVAVFIVARWSLFQTLERTAEVLEKDRNAWKERAETLELEKSEWQSELSTLRCQISKLEGRLEEKDRQLEQERVQMVQAVSLAGICAKADTCKDRENVFT